MANEDKRCAVQCQHCGMDMDMEPYCVRVEVLALRTKETGREYAWGLDVNPARRLCKGDYWEPRK